MAAAIVFDAKGPIHALQTPNEGINKSKKSENLGQFGRQNMLRPYGEGDFLTGHP